MKILLPVDRRTCTKRMLSLMAVAAFTAAAAASPSASLVGTWRCSIDEQSAVMKDAVMKWNAIIPADGCDGEPCRLTMDRPLYGTLVADGGESLSLVGLRSRGSRRWLFRDLRGGVWQLKQGADRLVGILTVGDRSRPVACRKWPLDRAPEIHAR